MDGLCGKRLEPVGGGLFSCHKQLTWNRLSSNGTNSHLMRTRAWIWRKLYTETVGESQNETS